jgi:Ca-activated chloride channel homolog
MTDSTSTPRTPSLSLAFAADRHLIWEEGDSVRYLVADIGADGVLPPADKETPLNLALAIDVSGSMGGGKLEAARQTAIAVAEGMRDCDRLTVVSFADVAALHLDAVAMDTAGKRAARNAIQQLHTLGSTALFDGWALAGEHVALAMRADDQASHRILLLTDGQANVGLRDPAELARHTGALQERGILTSAVGIGDDYEEALLAGMVEAGGGRLHDAADAQEISEVVLGELLEGRRALVERAMLRVQVGAVDRAEVVGAWSNTVRGGVVEVLVGSLQPGATKRVVIRVFCSVGAPGERIPFSAQVTAQLPDGSGEISADAPEITLTFAEARQNSAQRRNAEVSLAALTAWQSETMRRAIQLNRAHDRRRARHYLSKELRFIEAYARGLAGAEPLMIELALLSEQIEEEMDERVRKDVFMASMKRERGEGELRSRPVGSVREMLRRPRR